MTPSEGSNTEFVLQKPRTTTASLCAKTGTHDLEDTKQQAGEPLYYQLMHVMLKNTELLKHYKINKNAPCFGLHRNHLQGAKVSAWLKITHLVNSICVKDVQGVVSTMAEYCDCNKGYVCNM